MTEISGVSQSSRIVSKSKATMEGIQAKKEISASQELKELKQFEVEMQKAFTLAQEIRQSLETALKNLSS